MNTIEQAAEIFLGMWPTTVPFQITATACRSSVFPVSCLHDSSSPRHGVHVCIYNSLKHNSSVLLAPSLDSYTKDLHLVTASCKLALRTCDVNVCSEFNFVDCQFEIHPIKNWLLSESAQIIAAKFSGYTIGSYESASCTIALPMYILDLTS